MRSALSPAADASPAAHTSKTEWVDPATAAEMSGTRAESAATAAALASTLTDREADARREVPRSRTDAANPNKSRSLPTPTTVRGLLSSNRKKDYNKTKRAWVEGLPKTRRDAVQRVMGDRENLEGVNRALHSTTGRRSQLSPAIRKRVEATDRAIADAERTNEREHIVYAVLRPPHDYGSSRAALNRRLTAMSARGDGDPVGATQRDLTFDGYVPATHSLGTIPQGRDVVMEIRTRSGAYLGTSDTTLNADHVIGRGRVLRPVGVHEVPYIDADGSRQTRRVVQMEDVTPEG